MKSVDYRSIPKNTIKPLVLHIHAYHVLHQYISNFLLHNYVLISSIFWYTPPQLLSGLIIPYAISHDRTTLLLQSILGDEKKKQ